MRRRGGGEVGEEEGEEEEEEEERGEEEEEEEVKTMWDESLERQTMKQWYYTAPKFPSDRSWSRPGKSLEG